VDNDLIRYDLYLGEAEVRRRRGPPEAAPSRRPAVFENRWIVTHVLPATDERIDFEAFARAVRPDEVLRSRMTYLVLKRGQTVGTATYTTRQPLTLGW
jgi:hypothetical protein